jgi:hypothetical protein
MKSLKQSRNDLFASLDRPALLSSGAASTSLFCCSFDMIQNRWDESLSPGNEQPFYWGSAAADGPAPTITWACTTPPRTP